MMASVPLRKHQFIKGISVSAFILFHFVAGAQINCANTSTGNIPLVDLEGLFLKPMKVVYIRAARIPFPLHTSILG